MHEMVVEGTGACANNFKPVVLLRQKSADRSVRIFVNQSEADAIAVGLHKVTSSRPLTHDLITSVITELGGQLESVRLLGATGKHVRGRLVLRHRGLTHEIDCRPGDAVALAIRTGAPILADEALLERNALGQRRDSHAELCPEPGIAGVSEEELKKLTVFRDFIDTLDLDDLERA